MKQVALITGGSRGIGLGIARALAQKGFDLIINGMRPQSAVSDVLEELKVLGSKVAYCPGNISDRNTHTALLETAKKTFGGLHVLINNAGIAPPRRKDILVGTEASFDLVLETNLKGPYFLTQKVSRWMIEQKETHPNSFYTIINISSISATVASVNRPEYCISKAGLSMATKLWAARLGEYEIPVYEIQPGIILTDMTAGVTQKYDALFANGLTLQKRWGTAEDVGRVAAAMADHQLPYATGQVVKVDGGLTIQRL